ncbi:hypothetical protein C2S53_015770 [Perilla frutescens var. hirtella]|uniref:AAA+ ATPase domain-containing protein n=1 Tax=Perilla frutescens var. hirtella TaxID=608512 RepID=A0AAD4J5N6_PERFH|nr:hypothetical protein C2S53_015770 [Perilla frutescens var. hirtella]
MGRRRGGGGGGSGKPQSNSDRILRRHIEAAGKNYSTVEELVDHLRSSYPHYSRHKVRPFTKHVERVIMVSSRRNDAMDDSNDDGDTPIVKKRRKADGKEEKLQLIEAEHVRRRSVSNNGGGGSSSSLASASSSEGGDSSDEEASTSDDAVYGEKFEPEYDLMKSMMREDLRRRSKKLGEGSAAKEAVELEMVVDNKGVKELNLMNEEPKLGGNSNKIDMNGNLNKIDMNDSSGRDGNEVNRPMFKNLGGMNGVIEELKMEVIVPLYHPQLPRHLGVKPMAGILLHGPPGCGKTRLAHAIANETGVPFYKISATELVSGVSGAFEENIRELFSKAYMRAPSIVFIDEIDSITSKKENPLKEIESRIVNRLMACMDESCRLIKPVNHYTGSEISNSTCGYVLVIGATSRLDAVDPTLRQQFDREIVLGVPDESARLEILSVLTCNLKVEVDCDLAKIARSTMGFVGGDLVALAKKAGILAVNRIVHKRNLEISKKSDCFIIRKDIEGNTRSLFSDEEMEKFSITMEDFKGAIRTVQPSSKMEEFYTIPNAKWDDVVGLQSLKQEFDCHIIRPIKFPDVYKDLGRDSTTTFFLYGPSGCGKTLIVEALANEAGANFIHIKCLELHTYTDHSKLVLQNIISNARTWSPCILFFDGPYVPLPSPEERGMILKALAGNKPIDANVDLMALGKDAGCENFSGADLYSLMKAAARCATVRRTSFDGGRSIPIPWTIKDAYFKTALKIIASNVSFRPRVLLLYFTTAFSFTCFVASLASRLDIFGCRTWQITSVSLRKSMLAERGGVSFVFSD